VEQLVQVVTPVLADPGDVVFDLSELQFVDSTGVRAFLDVGRQLRGRGRLVLASPGRAVKRVLDLMGVAGSPQTFDVRDSSQTTLA
jgi:anti-anti-sigma factor